MHYVYQAGRLTRVKGVARYERLRNRAYFVGSVTRSWQDYGEKLVQFSITPVERLYGELTFVNV